LNRRLIDANLQAPAKSVLKSIQFHSNGQLLLAASLDRSLRLFQFDGRKNPKVQGVFLQDMPIYSAFFTNEGKEIMATGRRRFFYIYDIASGTVKRIPGIHGIVHGLEKARGGGPSSKYLAIPTIQGKIVILSSSTKSFLFELKMNGSVENVTFSPDNSQLFSYGSAGEIFQWDLSMRKCIHKYKDEGSLKTTTLAISSNGVYHATGSEIGVVNIYRSSEALEKQNPIPLKRIFNLTTSVNNLLFNHSTQLLALSSNEKKNALKMAHLPSFTIFSNFPKKTL